jgi:hypothetical protein
MVHVDPAVVLTWVPELMEYLHSVKVVIAIPSAQIKCPTDAHNHRWSLLGVTLNDASTVLFRLLFSGLPMALMSAPSADLSNGVFFLSSHRSDLWLVLS